MSEPASKRRKNDQDGQDGNGLSIDDEFTLIVSIKEASSIILQNLVWDLCKIPEARESVVKRLLVAPNKIPMPPKSKKDEVVETGTAVQPMVPRHSQCGSCNKVYDLLENNEVACRFHIEGMEYMIDASITDN